MAPTPGCLSLSRLCTPARGSPIVDRQFSPPSGEAADSHPPHARRHGLDISVDGATAGVVTRSLAAGVDVAVVVLVAAALDLVAAGARFAWSPVTFRWPQPAPVVTAVVL